MPRSSTEINLHFVWATKKREQVLTPPWEPMIYRCVQQECQWLGCTVLALGGIPDHVHLLAVVPGHLAASKLMQQVKGVSARFANGELPLASFLKWQEGYHAVSVSRSDILRVKHYIECQEQHHTDGTWQQEWEQLAED